MKPDQLQVVAGILRGRNMSAVLPTGLGKSLCFACLPTAFDQLHLDDETTNIRVIAPLTAIMKDQGNKTNISWTMACIIALGYYDVRCINGSK